MASIGHVFFGLAIGRAHDGFSPLRDEPSPSSTRERIGCALLFPVLSLLPDADVVAFKLGIPYEHAFGHRGASHSLMFALVAGVLVAFAVSKLARTAFVVSALACVVTLVSHPLLDALTNGGLGVALLWPFSDERFFAPWRPLPVAPIGARFFTSTWGLRVALTEIVVFAPFLLYAIWPRRLGRPPRGHPRPSEPSAP